MVNVGHSRQKASADVASHAIKTDPRGEEGTLDYRVHFTNAEAKAFSPWHSVPLYAGPGLLNFVCEIPRNTRAKYEVATSEPGNPIKQDSKKGKPRFYALDILWNYGMLPQTWEDPSHASEECDGHIGDNDPVDVVEIGDMTATTGGIYAVKPVAAFAMIDEGELDWKVVAIAATDPRCALVNDVTDMEEHFPGTLSAIREWFRTYKLLEGKPLNKFALGERAMPREYTMNVVAQTHGFWRSMVHRSKAGTEQKLAVGDVPIPTRYFVPHPVGSTDEMKVHEGVEKLKSVLEAVSEHEKHAVHKRVHEPVEEAVAQEHDSKRAELLSVVA